MDRQLETLNAAVGPQKKARWLPALCLLILAAAIPLAVYADATYGVWDLLMVQDGDPILADDWNYNFAKLGEHAKTYEGAISVDEETGNVGIGTAESGATLQVQDAAATNSPTLLVRNSARRATVELRGTSEGDEFDEFGVSGALKFADTAHTEAAYLVWSSGEANQPLAFWINGGRKVDITKEGNVGIGTVEPQGKLHVEGTIFADGAVLKSKGMVHGGAFVWVTSWGEVTSTTATTSGVLNFATTPANAKYNTTNPIANKTNATLICRALGFARADDWTTRGCWWHHGTYDSDSGTWTSGYCPDGSVEVFDTITCRVDSCMDYETCGRE